MASTADHARKVKVITVNAQIKIIQIVAVAEIAVSFVIVLSQSIAIAASFEFASRSLTGIWTSWFFFMAAGFALFWSVRCTFNGLLAVLVLQIIAATMTIPLFTACSIILGVYQFKWNPDEDGQAMVGSSITIMTTNLIMVFASIAELVLNAYNAYNCYFLAYGGKPKENNYDDRSMSTTVGRVYGVGSEEGGGNDDEVTGGPYPQETKSSSGDPTLPSPPPDSSLASTDILIIKYCGVTGVILAIIIFCSQTTMLALANNDGIKIGVGIWGALFYVVTGIVTVYCGWKPSSQSAVTVFILHMIQLALSVPLVAIAYYIVAYFGSCLQQSPLPDCTYTFKTGFGVGDLIVTYMAGGMALCGMAQGLISLILVLICAQAVFGIRCMISGASVYPAF